MERMRVFVRPSVHLAVGHVCAERKWFSLYCRTRRRLTEDAGHAHTRHAYFCWLNELGRHTHTHTALVFLVLTILFSLFSEFAEKSVTISFD